MGITRVTIWATRLETYLYFWGYGIPYTHVKGSFFISKVMWAKVTSWQLETVDIPPLPPQGDLLEIHG